MLTKKNRYGIRNVRTAKYLKLNGCFGPLDSYETQIFTSRREADRYLSDLRLNHPRSSFDAVLVETVRA
jgi:hypothetical protein